VQSSTLAPGAVFLAVLFACVAMLSAFQMGPAAVQNVQVAATKAPPLFFNVILDDELDNDAVPTDATLTPARGCKGCFG